MMELPTVAGMPPLRRAKRRVGPEDSLQVAVWRTLKLVLPADAVAWSVENNNNGVNVATARRARGCVPGIPDMAVHWPVGRIAYVELKAEKGRLEESQKAMFPRIQRTGIPVGVCRDIDEVLRFLRDQGCPLRCRVP